MITLLQKKNELNNHYSISKLMFILFFSPLFFSINSYSETQCQIEIAYQKDKDLSENNLLNDRLKKHQKLRNLNFTLNSFPEAIANNKEIKIQFTTLDNKKFETYYKINSTKSLIWKTDFSKSHIFPELFKNYLNITYFQSKYFLYLYDSPGEKTLVKLIFKDSDCRLQIKQQKVSAN